MKYLLKIEKYKFYKLSKKENLKDRNVIIFKIIYKWREAGTESPAERSICRGSSHLNSKKKNFGSKIRGWTFVWCVRSTGDNVVPEFF